MKAHQLIQAVGAELQQQIMSYMQTEQRAAYRAVVQSLAAQRKLRPVFVMNKTKEQQAAWVVDLLRLKGNDAVAEQLLQIWLLKGQPTMLTTFLDAVGIEHDGNGEVTELPEEIAVDKAKAAIDALLAKFSPKQAALYLHMFQLQKPGGWPGLAEAMGTCEAVQLEAPAA